MRGAGAEAAPRGRVAAILDYGYATPTSRNAAMTKGRNRLQEDPHRSSTASAPLQDNPASRQGEGRQNAQQGDRGASARTAGERRQQGQGARGGNRKPQSRR
jgi:hypothetical protein